MEKLITIRTTDLNKLKNVLTKNQVEYEIINEKKPTKKNKLREYIEMKSKENIFADYGEAIKDKELEAEKELLENDLE